MRSAGDREDAVVLGRHQRCTGRSRALHMWQLGSKLKTSCRLYFDCPPSLFPSVYTVSQIGKPPCVCVIKSPKMLKVSMWCLLKHFLWEEYKKVSSPLVNYVSKSIQIARSVLLFVSHTSEAHALNLSGRGLKISCVCN